MKEPDSANQEQLERKYSDAVHTGVEIGKSIVEVEEATQRFLRRTGHAIHVVKRHLVLRPKNAGQR